MKTTLITLIFAAATVAANPPVLAPVAPISWPIASQSDARGTIEASAQTATAGAMSFKDIGAFVGALIKKTRPEVTRDPEEPLDGFLARALVAAKPATAPDSFSVSARDANGKQVLTLAIVKPEDLPAALEEAFERPVTRALVPLQAPGWTVTRAVAYVAAVEDGVSPSSGQPLPEGGVPVAWELKVAGDTAYFPWALVADDSSLLCVEAADGKGKVCYLLASTRAGGNAGNVKFAEKPPEWWPAPATSVAEKK